MVLTDPRQSFNSSFNQNMANVKMQDAYYLETSLKGTDAVIIIANDQLRSTTTHLLSFLLEIVSVVEDEYQKQGIIISKKNSFVLAVLFLLFSAPVFHDIYVQESK